MLLCVHTLLARFYIWERTCSFFFSETVWSHLIFYINFITCKKCKIILTQITSVSYMLKYKIVGSYLITKRRKILSNNWNFRHVWNEVNKSILLSVFLKIFSQSLVPVLKISKSGERGRGTHNYANKLSVPCFTTVHILLHLILTVAMSDK